MANTSIQGMLSNLFKKVVNTWDYDKIGIFANAGTAYQQIAFRVPIDVEKEYFDEHQIYLQYELATPYIEEYEDFYKIPLKEDTINVYYINDDLEPNIYNKYYTHFVGTEGTSIVRTEVSYAISASNTVTPEKSEWVSEIPETSMEDKYLWTRTTLTLSDGVQTTSYSVSSTMDSIGVGARNYIKGSKKFVLDSTRANGWTGPGAFTFEEEDGFAVASIAVEGNETSQYHSIRSNYIDIKTLRNQIFAISFDFKVDDVANWTFQSPFIWEVYAEDGTRVGWKDAYLTDTAFNVHELESGVWTRITFIKPFEGSIAGWTEGKTIDDAVYAGIRLCLIRNGSIHYKKVKLEIGNVATDWSAAPEDTEEGITKAQNAAETAQSEAGAAKQTADSAIDQIKNANDSIKGLNDSQTTLNNKVDNNQSTSVKDVYIEYCQKPYS